MYLTKKHNPVLLHPWWCRDGDVAESARKENTEMENARKGNVWNTASFNFFMHSL